MLKADIELTSLQLENLFKLIWDLEEIPNDWEEGLIVKLPKKRKNKVDSGLKEEH